jgi:peptidylglycine monooxygenase
MPYTIYQNRDFWFETIPSGNPLTLGVFLHFTNVEQPKTAGVILLGTGGQAPPHTTTFFETACEMEDPRTLHPIAFRVHTHGLGQFFLPPSARRVARFCLVHDTKSGKM